MRITASPFVPVKDQSCGFVYDVEPGRLHEVTRREASYRCAAG